MFARKTHFSSDFIQSLNRFLVKFLRAAQHLGLIQQLRVEFYGLHLQICGKEVSGIGQGAVALQQDSVEIRKVFLNGIRNLVTASGIIGCVSGIPAIAKLVA